MITLVVARASNGVIGDRGALPWRLPADLARFRVLTMGRAMVMGRKTFESIGRALPGRRSLVVTRDPAWRGDGAEAFGDLASALAAAGADACVIGGAQIYAAALPRVEVIELTEVHARPRGDTVLAAFDPAIWREVWREAHDAVDGGPAFDFVRLERAQR